MSQTSSSTQLFGDLLALARQSWVRQMARRLEQRGYPDYRRSDAGALRVVAGGPTTIGGLGAELGVTRQAARKLVSALEQRGYAQAETDAVDARRVTVVLTAAGVAYAQTLREVVEALNRDFAAGVPPDELAAASRVLRAALDPALAQRGEGPG